MKKFLAILIIVLSTVVMLGSPKMQAELITYWKTNGIEYEEDDEEIWLPITEDGNITVLIPKEADSIVFEFKTASKIDDYVELFLKTEKLPYSEQFRKDLLECLAEGLNYSVAFDEPLYSYFEQLDSYFVKVIFLYGMDKDIARLAIV
jgi:hypothetical protein